MGILIYIFISSEQFTENIENIFGQWEYGYIHKISVTCFVWSTGIFIFTINMQLYYFSTIYLKKLRKTRENAPLRWYNKMYMQINIKLYPVHGDRYFIFNEEHV
jgi:hypothetical protein